MLCRARHSLGGYAVPACCLESLWCSLSSGRDGINLPIKARILVRCTMKEEEEVLTSLMSEPQWVCWLVLRTIGWSPLYVAQGMALGGEGLTSLLVWLQNALNFRVFKNLSTMELRGGDRGISTFVLIIKVPCSKKKVVELMSLVYKGREICLTSM